MQLKQIVLPKDTKSIAFVIDPIKGLSHLSDQQNPFRKNHQKSSPNSLKAEKKLEKTKSKSNVIALQSTKQTPFQSIFQNVFHNSNKQIKSIQSRKISKKILLENINSLVLSNQQGLKDLMNSNELFLNKDSNSQQLMNQDKIKKKQISCSCKKSKCLKLYCQCFSKQLFCGDDCSCSGCSNISENKHKILAIRQEYLQKKGIANIQVIPQDCFESKGCKCTKSGCTKKYCDCFSKGIQCTSACQCTQCQNIPTQKRQKPLKGNKKLKS